MYANFVAPGPAPPASSPTPSTKKIYTEEDEDDEEEEEEFTDASPDFNNQLNRQSLLINTIGAVGLGGGSSNSTLLNTGSGYATPVSPPTGAGFVNYSHNNNSDDEDDDEDYEETDEDDPEALLFHAADSSYYHNSTIQKTQGPNHPLGRSLSFKKSSVGTHNNPYIRSKSSSSLPTKYVITNTPSLLPSPTTTRSTSKRNQNSKSNSNSSLIQHLNPFRKSQQTTYKNLDDNDDNDNFSKEEFQGFLTPTETHSYHPTALSRIRSWYTPIYDYRSRPSTLMGSLGGRFESKRRKRERLEPRYCGGRMRKWQFVCCHLVLMNVLCKLSFSFLSPGFFYFFIFLFFYFFYGRVV
jgi:ribosomal protein L12E/L44/L45/RPP1/RPP2